MPVGECPLALAACPLAYLGSGAVPVGGEAVAAVVIVVAVAAVAISSSPSLKKKL